MGQQLPRQLADGPTVDKTSRTQIGSAANWFAIAAGGVHTVALKSDCTLCAWGRNNNGELGNGTTVNKTSAAQVSTGATDWSANSAA